MKRITLIAVPALIFAGTLAAQAQIAQIPTPANPFPPVPVATNGTPLLTRNNPNSLGYRYSYETLASGRSVGLDNPVSAVVGTGIGAAGTFIGAGFDTVNGVTGLGR